jgi:hypothetical protein
MSEKVDLRLDWCSHEAAKYAVEHWHYSHDLPAGKSVKIGAWENDKFVGCVIYSLGANKYIGSPYGITQNEVCELTRVALSVHSVPTSKIVAISIKLLKKQSPGLRLIVSYADTNQGHHGGIYQASNWIYSGCIDSDGGQMLNGEIVHRRTVYARYGRQDIEWLRTHVAPDAHYVKVLPKHKYLMPLDDAMRKQIEPLRKPYPKRGTGETDNAPETNRETGGARPTVPLLSKA